MNWTEVQAKAASEGWDCSPEDVIERLDACAQADVTDGVSAAPEDCTFYHAARLIEHLMKQGNGGGGA